MTTRIPDPIKIHPLIKFCRYSLLTAGIIYGATRQKTLEILEAGKAGIKEQRRIEKAKQLEIEKQLALERDLIEIISIFTNKPLSSFIGETAELRYREQSTQTVPDSKNGNNGESSVSESNNIRTQETVGKCQENPSEIYKDDDKPSCNTPVDNVNVESKQNEECGVISKETSTDKQSLQETNGGRKTEVDTTNDQD